MWNNFNFMRIASSWTPTIFWHIYCFFCQWQPTLATGSMRSVSTRQSTPSATHSAASWTFSSCSSGSSSSASDLSCSQSSLPNNGLPRSLSSHFLLLYQLKCISRLSAQRLSSIQTKPVRSTKQEYTFLKFNDYIFANINCIMRLILPTKINDE